MMIWSVLNIHHSYPITPLRTRFRMKEKTKPMVITASVVSEKAERVSKSASDISCV